MRGGKRPGAGRKPAPLRQAITVRVTPETAKRFADYCKASNKSQSSVFAELVDLLDDPILLWKGSRQEEAEPNATIIYDGEKYAIPYTLWGLMRGWLIIGSRINESLVSSSNLLAMMERIEIKMAGDAAPLTDNQIAFYKKHGIETKPILPEVEDFSANRPIEHLF